MMYTSAIKAYTVGFVFSTDLQRVVLVTKNRPEWQKGKQNGPGGKIEEGETSIACMVREIREETSLETHESDWRLVIKMVRPGLSVDFYAMVLRGDESKVVAQTDEQLDWYDVKKIPDTAIINIHWLVPLALETLSDQNMLGAEIHYSDDQ